MTSTTVFLRVTSKKGEIPMYAWINADSFSFLWTVELNFGIYEDKLKFSSYQCWNLAASLTETLNGNAGS